MDPIELMAASNADLMSPDVDSKLATTSVRQLKTKTLVSFWSVLNSSVRTVNLEQKVNRDDCPNSDSTRTFRKKVNLQVFRNSVKT